MVADRQRAAGLLGRKPDGRRIVVTSSDHAAEAGFPGPSHEGHEPTVGRARLRTPASTARCDGAHSFRLARKAGRNQCRTRTRDRQSSEGNRSAHPGRRRSARRERRSGGLAVERTRNNSRVLSRGRRFAGTRNRRIWLDFAPPMASTTTRSGSRSGGREPAFD